MGYIVILYDNTNQEHPDIKNQCATKKRWPADLKLLETSQLLFLDPSTLTYTFVTPSLTFEVFHPI